jgi:hypothetical protein
MERNDNVYWTKDYEIFKFLDGNRIATKPEDLRHIKELAVAIEDHGWWRKSHITVNKDLVIMDGQFRIWALKHLQKTKGLIFEIGYEIDNSMTLADVQRINVLSKKWTILNHLDSFVALGNKNYIFIKDIINTYGISINAVLTFTTSNGVAGHSYDTNIKFKNGNIILSNAKKEKIIYYMVCVEQLAPYFSDYKSVRFLKAFKYFLDNPKFKFSEFVEVIKLVGIINIQVMFQVEIYIKSSKLKDQKYINYILIFLYSYILM